MATLSDQNDTATVANTVTVMIGSALNFQELEQAAIYKPLEATGNVGLDGMGSAVILEVLQNHDMNVMAQDWSGTGSGMQEESESNGSTTTTVTLRNNTGSAISVPVEGAVFATSTGVQFQAVGDIHVGNWTASGNPNGLGTYVVAAGQTITIPVEALNFGPASNVATNAIISSSVAGLTVTGSAAATDPYSWTSPANANQNGFLTTAYSQYTTIFNGQGFSPAESNVNIDESHEWTTADLSGWEGYVDNCRSLGILNVAPIWTDNEYTADLLLPFATSPWFANVRAAALYSGGLAFDIPPNYWTGRTWDNYQENVEQMIQWCNQNGLRSSVIIDCSPPSTGTPAGDPAGYDPVFMQTTLSFLSTLKAAGAVPSQVVIENYVTPAQGNWYDANPADTQSLNAVAAAVAEMAISTPTPSEAGLEVKGTNKAQTTLIMTGVQSGENEAGPKAFSPYAVAQVHGVSTTANVTVSITDTSGLLNLTDGTTGKTYAAGQAVTFVGNPAQVTVFLKDLTAQAELGVSGTAHLQVTLTDYLGEVTSAVTPITVDNHQAVISSVSSNLATPTIYTGTTLIIGLQPSEAVSVSGTPLITLSNGRTAAYLGEAANGNLQFSYTVAAGDQTSDLRVVGLTDPNGSITDGNGTPINVSSVTTAVNSDLKIAVSTIQDAFTGITTSVKTVGGSGAASANSTIDQADDVIQFNVTGTGALSVSGTQATLSLDNGGTATFASVNPDGSLTFVYTIPPNQYDLDVKVTGLSLNGAAIEDSSGNPVAPASITLLAAANTGVSFDTMTPTVTQISAQSARSVVGLGQIVTFTLNLNDLLSVAGGKPFLTLSNSGEATWVPSSGLSGQLTFEYVVAAGQDTTDLKVTGLSLGGATIANASGTTLAVPTLSGLTGADSGIKVSSELPSVTAISVNDTSMAVAGEAVIFTLSTSEPTTVTGSPTLLLSNGQAAVYSGQSPLGQLQFTYKVGQNADTAALQAVQVSLSGGSIVDVAGNALTTPPLTSVAGDLNGPEIDSGMTTTANPDMLTLAVAEDSFDGDAQMAVLIGGVSLGTYTVTATNSQNQLQYVNIPVAAGLLTSSPAVTVQFLNDYYVAGEGDRNLYVNSIALDGKSVSLGDQSIWGSTTFSLPPPDTLILNMSEDAYLGNSEFTVSVNGQQVGGVFTTSALHSAGNSQQFILNGNFVTNPGSPQTVSINFINDAWGGSATLDRNLYLNSFSLDGQDVATNAELFGNGSLSYSMSGPDALTIGLSEDAFNGDAQYAVSVNGVQMGAGSVTASHSAGNVQYVTYYGNFGTGTPNVAVSFLNDAYEAGVGDRNLYVNSMTFDGQTTNFNSEIGMTSTQNFSPLPAQQLTINASEDAFAGDAEFIVTVDGSQVGSVMTVTALHSQGQSDNFVLNGDFGTGQHNIGISFINDAYGGSPSLDRNLYINAISIGDQTLQTNYEQFTNGTANFTMPSDPNSLKRDLVVGPSSTSNIAVPPSSVSASWNSDLQYLSLPASAASMNTNATISNAVLAHVKT